MLTQEFQQGLLALLPRLRRFAAGLARDPADADDLCQLAIERALRSREQWLPGSRLDSWMYRIMRNIWIDEARARTRRGKTFVDEEQGLGVGAAGGQEALLELNDVDRALAKLPDEQREAVLLVMVEGYSYKEAAEIVGCPVGTLNSRLVRGRDALLALLGEAGMTIAPEMLAAYADGELDDEAAGVVEAEIAASPELQTQLAAHRALRARLAAHFAPVAEQAVPDRLVRAVTGEAAEAEVIDFAGEARRRRAAAPQVRWMRIAAPALAASLVLALIGINLAPSRDYARGELADALDTQLIATQKPDAPVRVLLSFRDKDGAYCRGFAGKDRSGIACHDEHGWRLRKLLGGSNVGSAEFRQAGSAEAALMAQAQEMAAGPALDSAEEIEAARRGWQVRWPR